MRPVLADNAFLRWLLALPRQASSVAGDVDNLHYFVIGVTMLGSAFVFALALWFLVRWRRRPGDLPTPHLVTRVRVEAGIIVGLLALFLVVWVVGFKLYLRMSVPPPDALEVYVMGKQWMWKFAYPQGPSTVGVLYVPVDRPVKLLLTSRDVIHSFFVPAFRIKQDAVPGRYTIAWFRATETGTFRAFCTEYCGTGHSQMLAEVVVLPADQFERWLRGPAEPPVAQAPGGFGATDTWPRGSTRGMAARGLEVASVKGCLRCHSVDGTPHIGPTWLGLFGTRQRLTDGREVIVDEAFITQKMMDPPSLPIPGYPPVMPTFQGLVEPGDSAAIVELIKSLRDARAGPPPMPGLPGLAPAPPAAPTAPPGAAPGGAP